MFSASFEGKMPAGVAVPHPDVPCNIRQTSLEAYIALREEGELGMRQREVYSAFVKHGPHTDLEIARLLRFKDANMVRPRRNELVRMGFLVEQARRKCEISGRKAIVWGAS